MTLDRRSGVTKSPPTAVTQAITNTIRAMPWYQRFLVRMLGIALMVGPAYAGVRLVPHLVHEGTSWMLALILLSFLVLLMFVGLLITIPKAADFLAGLLRFVPIPAKWKQSLTERPDRRNNG